MFPYRCETFTTANVSVLNVFKTSVDTINASSITSDMTIGANLNGGSLTLGAAGATVNVSGNTINIGAPSNIINVGTQADRTGLISIGSNSASTTSTGGLNLGSVSSGTGSVQLANGTSQTANIIIGNGNAVVTGSDKIIIGKSGKTVSISGATTLDNGTLNLSNATINVNSPLTPAYTYSAVAPIGSTGSGKIGEIVSATYSAVTIPTTTTVDLGSFTITKGTWALVGNFFINSGSSVITTYTTYWYDTINVFSVVDLAGGGQSIGGVNNTTIRYTDTTRTIILRCVINYTGTTITTNSLYYNVSATRIA